MGCVDFHFNVGVRVHGRANIIMDIIVSHPGCKGEYISEINLHY